MKPTEAARGLRKLDPTNVNTDHEQFSVYCDCGAYLGKTHLSHGQKGRKGGKDVGHLVPAMARQLRITGPLLRDIIGCSKGRAEYLAARDHDHSEDSPASN